MKFNEDLAREIVNRCELQSNVIKVWRCRGEIPNRFNTENIEDAKKLDSISKLQEFEKFLSCGYFNLRLVADETSISKSAIYAMIGQHKVFGKPRKYLKLRPTEKQYNLISNYVQNELSTLQNFNGRKFKSELKELAKNDLIIWSRILKDRKVKDALFRFAKGSKFPEKYREEFWRAVRELQSNSNLK